ncbi:MAG: hypothetical protein RL199_1160 [Pseudomonadota bacterium]|jgi:predicted metal-dependent peptidase
MTAPAIAHVAGLPEPGALNADDLAAKAEALRVWTSDRARFLLAHPLIATLALHLEIVPVVDGRLPTAATDGRRLFVNPYFLRGLTPEERVFLLAHEVWHEALLHGRRRGLRDAALWNVAADHEVNHLLRSDGLVMPADAVLFEEHAGRSAEYVFAALESTDHPGEDVAGRRRPGADVHLGAPDGADAVPDEGDAERRAADGSEDSTGSGRFGPIRGKFDPDFQTEPDPAAADDWTTRVVALKGQLAGRLPAGLEAAIEKVLRPRMPWQVLLRDFVSRSAGGSLSWLPPSRRHVHRGLYLPSRRNDLLRVAVALDTSGSTAGWMPRLLAEIGGIAGAFGRYEVRLIQCDAAVVFDETFDDTRPLVLPQLKVRGGGGTSFRPVFERLARHPPHALVFLTDGFGNAPRAPPPFPVLWLLTPDGTPPTAWGRVVLMH